LKLALTVWGNRISPVFDSARKLCLVEIENNEVVNREYEAIDFKTASDLINILSHHGIDVLICGAISRKFSSIIDASRTKLIPFITGHVDMVLKSYIKNHRNTVKFIMPGCRKQQCRQINSAGSTMNNNTEEVNMPGRDRTGPRGQGAGSGRNRGPCGKVNQGSGQGFGRNQRQGRSTGFGQGYGGKPGKGQGRGRGQGRRQGFGQGSGIS